MFFVLRWAKCFQWFKPEAWFNTFKEQLFIKRVESRELDSKGHRKDPWIFHSFESIRCNCNWSHIALASSMRNSTRKEALKKPQESVGGELSFFVPRDNHSQDTAFNNLWKSLFLPYNQVTTQLHCQSSEMESHLKVILSSLTSFCWHYIYNVSYTNWSAIYFVHVNCQLVFQGTDIPQFANVYSESCWLCVITNNTDINAYTALLNTHFRDFWLST